MGGELTHIIDSKQLYIQSRCEIRCPVNKIQTIMKNQYGEKVLVILVEKTLEVFKFSYLTIYKKAILRFYQFTS